MQKLKAILEAYKMKRKMGKKGVIGFDTGLDVIKILLVGAVLVIAVFLALSVLTSSGIFTSNSQSYNDTNLIVNNITTGTVKFFSYVPTIMTVLAVVVIVLAISLILFAVNRFAGKSQGGL